MEKLKTSLSPHAHMLKNKSYKESKGEAGFTLIEALFSFSICMILLLFLPLLLRFIAFYQHVPPYEVEVFILQIGSEIREARQLKVSGEDLLLYMPNGKIVSIEMYESIIRKRVNNSGHEVLVRNVVDLNWQKVNHGVTMSLTDSNNQVHEVRFSMSPFYSGGGYR